MSIQELLNSQASTRFLLALFSLIGVFIYGYTTDTSAGEVFGAVKFVVGTYGLNKAIEHGVGIVKK